MKPRQTHIMIHNTLLIHHCILSLTVNNLKTILINRFTINLFVFPLTPIILAVYTMLKGVNELLK